MAVRKLSYTVVLREEPEGGYTILVPALQEIVSYVQTLEEARAAAREVIELVLESRAERGEEIPVETIESVFFIPESELTGPLTLIHVTVTAREVQVARVAAREGPSDSESYGAHRLPVTADCKESCVARASCVEA